MRKMLAYAGKYIGNHIFLYLDEKFALISEENASGIRGSNDIDETRRREAGETVELFRKTAYI